MNQTVMDNKEFAAIQKFLTEFKDWQRDGFGMTRVNDSFDELRKTVEELGTQARVRV